METKPTRPLAPSSPMPGAGLGRDVARLKTDGRATVAELREFVHNLRGRPAGEVLGIVSESGLLRATLTATLGTIALIAVLTAVPYGLAQIYPKPVKAPKAAAGAETEKPSAEEDAEKPKKDGDSETANRGNEVLDKLGESESRDSDPRKNPLEELGDDLLKDIK